MRSILWVAAAAAIVLGGSGGSFAQGMGMGMYGAPPSARPKAPPPRTQRYYYRSRDVRAGTCGQFRYWDGKRCADARTSPPKLK
jgi:hypothetical protein